MKLLVLIVGVCVVGFVSAGCAFDRSGTCVGTGCQRKSGDSATLVSCDDVFKSTGKCECVAEPTCSTCNSTCPTGTVCVTPDGCLGPPCMEDGSGGCPGRCEVKQDPPAKCVLGDPDNACPTGYECVDDPDDECVPKNQEGCPGYCVKSNQDPCSDFEACIALYDPVCGTDAVTYGNYCELQRASCQNPDKNIDVACRQACPCDADQCPEACPLVYDPVCGKDGTTYGNQCELGIAACKNEKLDATPACQGPCPCQPECDRGCPDVWEPVCGKDGRTYGNQCELDYAACRDKSLDPKPLCEDACPCGKEACGGFVGTPCPDGEVCIDDPADDCDPDNGGADCIGFCVPEPPKCSSCQNNCDKGYFCKVDCLGPPCDENGFGGCEGKCVKEPSNCDIACDKKYEPVCGSDGRTYGNRCTLNVAICRNPETLSLACEGECPCKSTVSPKPTESDPCPFACTQQYDPVCGTDGKTYSNSCVLDQQHCRDPNVFQACAQECPCPDTCDFSAFDQSCSTKIKFDAVYANNAAVSAAISKEFCNEGFAVEAGIVECDPTEEDNSCAMIKIAAEDLSGVFKSLSEKFTANTFRGEYLSKWVQIMDEDCSQELSLRSDASSAMVGSAVVASVAVAIIV